MPSCQAGADALKGQWLHGYIVDGKMQGAAKPSVEDNPMITLVLPVMNTMFPGVGAKAAGGSQSWTDTTRSDIVSEAMTQHNQAVVAWTITSREGDLLTLTGAGTGTINMEAPDSQASGAVTTNVTVTTVIGGPAKSSKLTSSQQLSVVVTALPDPIPVKVETDATLTELP